MKTEFADLTETKKSVAVEIPSDIVDAEIDRVARSYSRQARIPGFRQGKVPPTLIKKRFREQILHDVAHDLIPRAIDEALRERIQQDLQREADAEADRNLKSDLLKELAARVTVDIPDALVERELDRRTEEFARRLMDQQIDPQRANIDWDQFRDSQREAGRESVKSALVLDEISRRDNVTVSDEDVDKDVAEYAGRSGLTPAAVRARLEKEGALARLSAGLRREKTIDYILAKAQVVRD